MGIIHLLLLGSSLLLHPFLDKKVSTSNLTGTLQVEIQNLQKAKGSVRIALFNSEEHFLEVGKAVAEKAVLVEKEGAVYLSFDNLPYGEYSMAIYHDVNDNQQLDTNLVGIPNEPYGFSNNARSKWGPPKYKEAHFDFNQSEQNMVIQVKKWSKQ